jgi:hypothetical protein
MAARRRFSRLQNNCHGERAIRVSEFELAAAFSIFKIIRRASLPPAH